MATLLVHIALLAYAAAGSLSPTEQLLTTSLGGAVALVAHGGKTAAAKGLSAGGAVARPHGSSLFVLRNRGGRERQNWK